MSSIDERVVEMRFRNGQFEKGVATSTRTLALFKESLNLSGAAKGLDGVNAAAKNVDISHIADSLDKVNNKFSILGVIGATAIGKLTSTAMGMAGNLISNVIDPIISGGQRRASNIEQAKFMLDGLKIAWDDILPSINYAVDGTAYGLDEAARAASSLAASGVKVNKDMSSSLRGISGVAAMTSSEYSDIAQIFTTVAGNGRLMSSELNRIGMRGLNAAAAIAEYMTATRGVKHTEADIREMTSKGEISFQMFANAMNRAFGDQATKANETYSGSLANVRAALARIGEIPAAGRMEQLRHVFNAIRPIINEVKDALEPLLTQIKTYQILSGKKVANFLEGLDLSWTKTFFRYVLLSMNSIRDSFNKFAAVAVKVWQRVFPSNGRPMQWLVNLADAFNDLVRSLSPSESALSNFEIVLTAVFETAQLVWTVLTSLWDVLSAGFGVVWQIIGIFVDFIKPLLKTEKLTGKTIDTMEDFFDMLKDGLKDGIKPVVGFLEQLRDALINLRDGGSSGWTFLDNLYNSIKQFMSLDGGGITKIFDGVGETFDRIVNFFKNIGDALKKFSTGDVMGGIKDFFGTFKEMFGEMFKSSGDGEGFGSGIITWFKDFFKNMRKNFGGFLGFLKPIGKGVKDALKTITDALFDFLSDVTLKDVLETSNLGMLLWIMIEFRDYLGTLKGVLNATKGSIESIGAFFAKDGILHEHLKTIQKSMKVTMFLQIAIAIGILAGALWLLAQIPTDRLISAGIALAVISVGLVFLFKWVSKLADAMTPEKLVAIQSIGKSLFVLSVSMLLLSGAMWILGQLSWEQIAKGLVSVIGLMGSLSLATLALTKAQPGMIKASIAIGFFAAALLTLAAAVWMFGSMDQDVLIQGGIAVASAIAILSGAIYVMGSAKNLAATLQAAFAIGIIVGSLLLLAEAIKIFAAFKWEEISSGVYLIAGSLAFIGVLLGSLGAMGSGAVKGAAAVAIVSGAILAIAGALWVMSTLDSGKALVDAIILVAVISVLMYISDTLNGLKTIMGATAIVILAGALMALALVFHVMADLDPGQATLHALVLLGTITILVSLVSLLDRLKPTTGAAALVILAGAMAVLALVFNMTAGLSFWKMVGDALVMMVVIALLGKIAIGLNSIKGAKQGAIAVAILSGSLLGIAIAMAIVSNLEPEKQLASLGTMLALISGLAIISVAMGSIKTGWGIAAMVILTAAIWVIAQSLTDLNSVPMNNLYAMAEVIVTIVGVLGAVVAVIALLTGQMPMAIVGILAFAAVIGAIALVMYTFSIVVDSISNLISVLIGGFVTFSMYAPKFAAAIEIVGAAASASSQHIWSMIGLGAGLMALGVGAAIAAFGLMALGGGLLALVHLASGLDSLEAVVMSLGNMIPMLMAKVGEGILAMAKVITSSAGVIVEAIVTVLLELIQGMSDLIGPAVEIILELALRILEALAEQVPLMVDAGLRMITGILEGIAANIEAIVIAAGELITAFLNGLTDQLPHVILAGSNMIVTLLNGIAANIGRIITAGVNVIVNFLNGIAANLGRIITAGVNVIVAFLNGIAANVGRIIAAGVNIIISVINGIGNALPRIIQAGADLIVKFLEGIANGIRNNSARINQAGLDIAAAIVEGIVNGLRSGVGWIVDTARGLAGEALSAVKNFLGIKSPSRKFMEVGVWSAKGMVNGLSQMGSEVSKAGMGVGESAYNGLQSGLGDISGLIESLDLNGLDVESSVSVNSDLASEGYASGASMVDGMTQGIRTGTIQLMAAVIAMSKSAVSAANNELDIRSPSRVFGYIGLMGARGFAGGFESGTGEVINATKNMGLRAITEAGKAVDDIQGMMDSDFTPTITPVLDLSEVRKGSGYLSSIMRNRNIGATVTANMAQSHAAEVAHQRTLVDADGSGTGSRNTTFVQNNYSPKALSTTEIYRKGKSLVAKAARVNEED